MKNIPHKNIFNEPDGYFDALADTIISRRNKKVRQAFITRFAAAAILLVGLSFMFLLNRSQESEYHSINIDEEVEMYISSGYWQAEDILLMSDDPNGLLDQIIEMEYLAYLPEPDPMDDDFWF